MTAFNAGNVSYKFDYRSTNDDAWYNCGIVLDHEKQQLRVKFEHFKPIENDEVFSITDFKDQDQLDEFIARFRPVSLVLDDNECSRVIEGMTVCATYGDEDSLRYFDAVVDAVYYKEHTAKKCLCNYMLFWQHGPQEGNITATKLENISLISYGVDDLILSEFSKLVEENLRGKSSEFFLIPKSSFLSKITSSNETLLPQEFGSVGHSSLVGHSKGKERFFLELSDQDRDMGGVKETGRHHYIILENLERDLCPTLMMMFIHEQTEITAQAYVFPNLSMETYARGAIVVESKSNLKRLYEFINNPNQFIVSSTGRPWVIAEDKHRIGNFKTNLQGLQPRVENVNTDSELKVVWLGTEEYRNAKQLKDLFIEYRNHLNGLAQRLEKEEDKVKKKMKTDSH
ncbi:uncharacterized protein [Rutidosis leptorrhynchoides]|uniref:uncharacterized protein n=1 Tax=Rutidosis leptorrhynchoides TaxID=125765 RepID=UPI003A98CED9